MKSNPSSGDSLTCAYINRFDLTVLRLEGSDALDFLQRISTNEVRDVNHETMRTTVLCTDKGRILDVVRVVMHPTGLLLLVSRARKEHVMRYLNTYIIMDDVRVRDASSDWRCAEFFGPRTSSICGEFLGMDIAPFPANRVFVRNGSDYSLLAFYIEPRLDESLLALYTTGSSSENIDVDVLASTLMEVDPVDADVWRIEQGIPVTDKELTVEHNPLEANLLHLVNFRKGCYIGQEVIARLDSYNKVKVRLVGLQCTQAVLEGSIVEISNAEPGIVTSACESPRFGHIALAYIRTEFATDGAQVVVKNAQDGSECTCTVCTLPFRRH